MAKNLLWTRDELLLALDVYFRFGYRDEPVSPDDAVVGDLSRELQSLPIYSQEDRSDQFRSRDAVAIHIGNFAGMDPESEYTGRGEPDLQQKIWDEFAGDPGRVREVADRIRECSEEIERESLSGERIQKNQFSEGAILTRVHKRRERRPRLVEKKKDQVLEEEGSLDCEICGFNFKAEYGDLIEDPFVECHHRIPLADLEAARETTVDDLALLCANCHRAIHRTDPMLSVSEFRKRLRVS